MSLLSVAITTCGKRNAYNCEQFVQDHWATAGVKDTLLIPVRHGLLCISIVYFACSPMKLCSNRVRLSDVGFLMSM